MLSFPHKSTFCCELAVYDFLADRAVLRTAATNKTDNKCEFNHFVGMMAHFLPGGRWFIRNQSKR